MRYPIIIIILLAFTPSYTQNVLASAELEAQNINEVNIEGSFCDVEVEIGDKNYLKGQIVGRGNSGDFTIDTDVIGSTLMVKVIRNNKSSWRGYNLEESLIKLTIKEGVSLDIDNSSGDISITGLSSTDSNIEASSGDIRMRNITANLEVETTSGDIIIEKLNGDLEMETTSGDQRLEDMKGALDTRSTSGDIEIVDFDGKLDIEATAGDIQISGGLGQLNVRTTSGNIEGDDIELTGNANFKASSGDIEIDFVNDLDDLSFDLTASSGDLEVGDRSGDKKLYIERGGYKVIGVTSSGDQEYE